MYNKYLALQADLETDMEYQALLQENRSADDRLRELIQILEPDQQDVIHQYLGTLAELQMREIELALMLK